MASLLPLEQMDAPQVSLKSSRKKCVVLPAVCHDPITANIGEGYVIFQNEAEAEKAKESRNKQTIMSRWIDLLQVSN